MRLTNCFMEVIAYVAFFLRRVSKKQPAYDQIKADVLRLLLQSESCVKENGVSQEDYDLGRFAVCVWMDEAILNSPWQEKDRWQTEQLQRVFYQTAAGGEAFFERLNRLGPDQQNVREVYYLCLALGFKGRHIHEGDEFLLDQLKTSNLKLLVKSPPGLSSLEHDDLFPEAYPSAVEGMEAQPARSRFSVLTLVCLVGPVVLFGVLFWIYRFVLEGVGESFMQAVR